VVTASSRSDHSAVTMCSPWSRRGHELGEACLAHFVEDDLERGGVLAVGLALRPHPPGAPRPRRHRGPTAPPARPPGPSRAAGRHHPQELVDALPGLGREQHGTIDPWASSLAAWGARSALFTTTSSGTSPAPISSQHRAHGRHLGLGVPPCRRPRGRGGRPGAPSPGWTGTPRPAGGAACVRSPPCRSPAPSRHPAGRTGACAGRA
jgi:hypothetical protein